MPPTTPNIAHLPAAARTAELHVVIAIEAAPHVYVDALNDGEEARLRDWIDASPAVRELVAQALRLGRRAA